MGRALLPAKDNICNRMQEALAKQLGIGIKATNLGSAEIVRQVTRLAH